MQVLNNSGVDIAAGKAVAMSGWDSTTSRLTIKIADASTDADMPAIGIVRGTIVNGGKGSIATDSDIVVYNTAGDAVGTIYYVGTTGNITKTPPAGSLRVQEIGKVITVGSTGKLYILPATKITIHDHTTNQQGGALAGGSTHNMLSASHLDSTPATAVRGDIITADATPKWVRKMISSVAGSVLMSDGFDLKYSVLASTDLSNDSSLEKTTNKNAANGYAGLSAGSKVAASQMSAVLASSDLTNDSALEKTANKGAVSGYAGLDAGTKVPTVQLGGVGADSTKFLRGDQTWAAPTAVAGDTSTKISAASSSTVLADTCRYICGHFEIVVSGHLFIDAGGHFEVG